MLRRHGDGVALNVPLAPLLSDETLDLSEEYHVVIILGPLLGNGAGIFHERAMCPWSTHLLRSFIFQDPSLVMEHGIRYLMQIAENC